MKWEVIEVLGLKSHQVHNYGHQRRRICDTNINGLIWEHVLCFASAICLEVLLLLNFTLKLCDDVCEADYRYVVILSAF